LQLGMKAVGVKPRDGMRSTDYGVIRNKDA
jgi:hypothetical protein